MDKLTSSTNSKEHSGDFPNDFDAAIRALEQVWLDGEIDSPDVLDIAARNELLARLLNEIQAVHRFSMAIANGDLSQTLKVKGRTAGSLKALQASLRHLTWQTEMIAQGDFTQRVDFMGEFSEAFNSMVQSLEQAQNELRETNRRLQQQINETMALHEQLQEQAIRDPLTNLFNRRYLHETLEREIAGSLRDKRPISLIMMDLDHFKRLNDRFGHKAGDLVLQALAKMLVTNTRTHDVVCRYGGEEFIAVMPGAPLTIARVRAEDWRNRIECLRIPYGDQQLQVTLSLGVAGLPDTQLGSSSDALLRAADEALYAAKSAGRNQVVVWNW
ncbi:MAG: diguanylate cyclase [Chloroflexi bacterium]|nr:diguanylate cyclase [Chloroflexota bacterium]